MNTYRNAIVAVALGGMLSACQPAQNKGPALPPIQKDPSTVDSVTSRVKDASREIITLESLTQQLPGKDETEHRQLMAKCFGEIAAILPMIEGPDGQGAFRQQMRLIESTNTQL